MPLDTCCDQDFQSAQKHEVQARPKTARTDVTQTRQKRIIFRASLDTVDSRADP